MKNLGAQENFTLPSGTDFPAGEEGELFVLNGHLSLSDGLYVYSAGEWQRSSILLTDMAGGQVFPSFDDPSRSNKTMSICTIPYHFNHASIKNATWLGTGSDVGALSGYVMPTKGTIVHLVAQAKDVAVADLDISVYVQGQETPAVANLLTTASGNTVSDTINNLNLDFNAGDKIQLRTFGSPEGPIENANFVAYVRWRL